MRAVFFDIGNVLLRFDVRALALELAASVRKKPVPMAKLLVSGHLTDRIERGRLSARGLYGILRRELEFRGGYEAFRRIWCGHFRLDPEAYRLFLRVSRRSRVFLLSNTNELHYAHIRSRYAFARRADGAVLSHRVGLRKPQVEIYRRALRMARARASEALFIDDMPANVRGARKAGMSAVLYRGARGLERELKSLGLLRSGRIA